MIRRHDLVKFVGPSACKYFGRYGTQDALVEDGTLGIVLSTVQHPYMYHYVCELLIGSEIFTASMDDLAVIQQGE